MVSDPISESAKATQEVSKTTGKAIDAVSDLGGWMDRMFGRAVEQTIALHWTDRVATRRIEKAIYDWAKLRELLHKTEQMLGEKGVTDFRVPPPKVMLPLLENATLEGDEGLQTMWARLLATSLDAAEAEVHRKYISILSDLTSSDAVTLAEMWAEWLAVDKTKEVRDSTLRYGPGVDGTFSHDEASVVTLNRLGLIAPAYIKIKTFEPGGHDFRYGDYGPTQDEVALYGDLGSVAFTKLGEAFCRAVIDQSELLKAG